MWFDSSTISTNTYRDVEDGGMRFDEPQTSEMTIFSVFLFLVVLHLIQVAYDGVQPATALILSIFMVIHVRLIDAFAAPLSAVGLSAGKVWQRGELTRLFTSPFYHVNDWHLLYSMVSFAMKARCIEPYFGKGFFFWLSFAYALLVNILLVPLAYTAYYIFGDPTFVSRHAFGFSGVIFALKVLTTQLITDGNARVFVWAELIVVNMLLPRTTALSNVAGTVVGALSLEMLWHRIKSAREQMDKTSGILASRVKRGRSRSRSRVRKRTPSTCSACPLCPGC